MVYNPRDIIYKGDISMKIYSVILFIFLMFCGSSLLAQTYFQADSPGHYMRTIEGRTVIVNVSEPGIYREEVVNGSVRVSTVNVEKVSPEIIIVPDGEPKPDPKPDPDPDDNGNGDDNGDEDDTPFPTPPGMENLEKVSRTQWIEIEDSQNKEMMTQVIHQTYREIAQNLSEDNNIARAMTAKQELDSSLPDEWTDWLIGVNDEWVRLQRAGQLGNSDAWINAFNAIANGLEK